MKSFEAQLDDMFDLTLEDLEFVEKQSISDVLVGAQTTQIGIMQGAGSFEEGKIPVGLTAELVNSLTVDGASGKDAYVVAIAGREFGESQEFGWTAEYAMRIEAGFTGTDELGRYYDQPGRYFVTRNAEKFEDHVKRNAAELHR